MTDDDARRAVHAEVARALADGPGIAVFRGAFEHDVVDRVTEVFEQVIAQEKAAGRAAGDHFAAPGANDRVWNALEKLAVADPEAFVDYYANDVLALAATRLARARATRSPARSTSSTPAAPARPCTATTTWASRARRPRPSSRRTCTRCRRCSPSRAPWPTATCRSSRARPSTCPTRRSTPTATSPTGCPSSRSTSSPTTCSCRWPRADAVFFNPALFHAAGIEPHDRRAPDGQPAAGVVGVRPRHGDRRPAPRRRGRLPGAVVPQGIRDAARSRR